jgi:hypothetical protein
LSPATAQSVPQTIFNAPPAAISSISADHNLRAEFYGISVEGGPELDNTEPLGRDHLIHVVDKFPIPELPGALADTIVLGTISNVQPYLTANHKGVFTEISVDVEMVFDHLGPLGHTLTIAAPGGFFRLPNGWIADQQVDGMGRPLSLKGRYVLFLKYEPKIAGFRIVKGWELIEGKAAAMAPDDLLRIRQGRSVFDGMPEANFISAVQQVRAKPSGK